MDKMTVLGMLCMLEVGLVAVFIALVVIVAAAWVSERLKIKQLTRKRG